MTRRKTNFVAGSETNTSSEVSDFMARLDHPRKAEIETVRAIILGADARIRESIKWNAPSFSTADHFATFRLQPHNIVQIVFHTGPKVKTIATEMKIDAPADLLKWITKDRCTVTFASLEDVKAKSVALEAVVRQWIKQV